MTNIYATVSFQASYMTEPKEGLIVEVMGEDFEIFEGTLEEYEAHDEATSPTIDDDRFHIVRKEEVAS